MKPTRKNITNITKKGSRKDVAENTQVEPKAKTLKPEKIDPVCAVVTKYTDNGWRVLRAPKGGVNDIVAQKDRRFHFVQVVTPETIDDPKYHGLSKKYIHSKCVFQWGNPNIRSRCYVQLQKLRRHKGNARQGNIRGRKYGRPRSCWRSESEKKR